MKRFYSIHARVSEAEYQALNLIATREFINTSEAFRLILRKELDRRGMTLSEIELNRKNPVLAEAKSGNPS